MFARIELSTRMAAVIFIWLAGAAIAQTGGGFDFSWNTISDGGDRISGGAFEMTVSLQPIAESALSGGPFQLDLGFQAGLADTGGCNGMETLTSTCAPDQQDNVVSAEASNGPPGRTVIFSLDGGRSRTRTFGAGGRATASWAGVIGGSHDVTAELECGNVLSNVAECPLDDCTGKEKFKKLSCDSGKVKIVLIKGVPGREVVFTIDGIKPRTRTFNQNGRAKVRWRRINSGDHTIDAALACGDILTEVVTCP